MRSIGPGLTCLLLATAQTDQAGWNT